MKRFNFVLILCILLFIFAVLPTNVFALEATDEATVNENSKQVAEEASADLLDDIKGLFVKQNQKQNLEEVVLGGVPIGISLDNEGIEVIGFSEIITQDGLKSPAADAGLEVCDRIIKINGENVSKVKRLNEIANSQNGKSVVVDYLRDGKQKRTQILPQKDILTEEYKLGLWAKDVSNGIGTLTFVRGNDYFGCLGHPIADKNGEIIKITGGKVYDCLILGVNKGVKGDAGELKGAFSGKTPIGTIYKNNKFGVYGKFETMPEKLNSSQKVEVANVCEVKPGKAQIYSTVEGNEPKFYDIEIVKVTNQSQKDDKGMVVRVVDKTLLEKTGGIVQGMSGSPILQNGKLVGAVTHVFVNDPTQGFGMFAQWMLTE